MKTNRFLSMLVATISIATIVPWASPSRAEQIALGPGFSEPLVRSGVSGGSNNTDCGFLAGSPNHQLSVAQDFGSLRVEVKGGDGMTLLVSGPSGRFCIPAANGVAQMPGYWSAGTYDIYVGDRSANARQNYQLSISTR